MKTKLFAFILATLIAPILVAQNHITDSDMESYKGLDIEHVMVSNKNTEAGKWLMFLAKDQTGFEVKTKQDKEHQTVLHLNTTTQSSWYKHYLMQRIDGEIEPGVYSLTFDAKADKDNTVLSNQILLAGESGEKYYVLKNNFDPQKQATSSGATSDVKLTKEWKSYELILDFSQMCNNINSPKSIGDKYSVEPTTEAALSDCRITFQAFKSKPSNVYLDNVILKKIEK